ncbi:MAG: hypothetical protein KAH62_03830, partial [Desulfobacula sp.]|nr:hypothetical protein [Desulfobacula sp.]
FLQEAHNNKEKIAKMADDVETLSTFYPGQVDFWKLLIKSIEKFQINLTEIKKIGNILIFQQVNPDISITISLRFDH